MPDRWRLGTRNPYTVYRVADGAHDADHAREHFVTSFRTEEDARRAVDAVNAQAGPHEDGLSPWATYRFDPNVRVRGVQTYTGYEDRLHGDVPRRGKTIRLVESESGMTVDGVVTETDDDKQLIYVAVDWSRLTVPDETPDPGREPTAADPWTATLAWTPSQNGGAVSMLRGRASLRAVWGSLDAGETPEVVADEFGCPVEHVRVVDRLRRELAEEGMLRWPGEGGDCARLDADGATARLAEALLHIDRNGCTNYTGGARCLDSGSGRTRDAEYTAGKWCDACVARDAVYPSGGEPADTQRADAVQVAETDEVGSALMRLIAMTESPIREVDDPGPEALGALHEARRVARNRAADTQRAAPPRDVLVKAFMAADVSSYTNDAAEVQYVRPGRALAVRMADVALAALRGAGADGGGEEAHVGETHVEGGHTLAHAAAELDDAHARVDVARDNVINGCVRDDLGRALAEIEVGRATLRLHRCPSEEVDDLARLASAAGVDPDAADPVGKIETVIREGRALPQPTSLADDQGVVADSFGLAAWVHDSGDTVYVNRDREVLVRPGRGQYVLSTGWLGQAILAAEQWADAHIEAGDEVTGDRAVTAPVGTKLGARNAAVAAVRTTGGWSVTGMSHEQDHEHAVRINEWVVLALGGRS